MTRGEYQLYYQLGLHQSKEAFGTIWHEKGKGVGYMVSFFDILVLLGAYFESAYESAMQGNTNIQT